MKLQPRVRRPRSDYIVDNAAAMQLGKLYLGWGHKKKQSKRKPSKPAAESKAKVAPAKAAMKKANSKAALTAASVSTTAKTSPRLPAKKAPKRSTKAAAAAVKRSTKAVPLTVKRPPGHQRKAPPPAAPAKGRPAKSSSRGRATTTPSKASPKQATRQRVQPSKKPRPAVMPISSKVMAAAGAAAAAASESTKTMLSSKPLPRNAVPPAPFASRKVTTAPVTKSAVQRYPRSNRYAPPVIPNPVPTPALSSGGAVQAFDCNAISVLVRTMNGMSFRLGCTIDSTLYDLKRRILEVIMPWTAQTSTGPVVRLPMLVMNGRALEPENATLAMLRFSSESTVYCFPEPT
ncbi:hypothetical protein JKF63_01257 [Porcisia hertigi]|uniref:Ubiquitin-like domain-containing protein n=1 Tax=Porcisia hertigi TaxID=2761500 RepID=A0A836I3D3_9TRYP|nr:hypothetical protein JKF63_01257 [Porcisia hertigi]